MEMDGPQQWSLVGLDGSPRRSLSFFSFFCFEAEVKVWLKVDFGVLCYAMPCYAMLCDAIGCRVMLVMLYCVVLCCIHYSTYTYTALHCPTYTVMHC
jgi:hypothetical protein